MKTPAKPNDEAHFSISQIGVEIFCPFLLAGLGMVMAGLLLDQVQHWEVFKDCPELFILVPALLGLKGNLEMTLASRLSTAANLGHMDGPAEAWEMAMSNLALVQIQGIVVGSLAACFAMLMGWGPSLKFDVEQAFLLTTSSVVTASLASFTLGVVMILVVMVSRKFRINPDNVATPVAASLGDLVTLAILTYSANLLHTLDEEQSLFQALLPGFTAALSSKILLPFVILFLYVAIVIPICFKIANQSKFTNVILYSGWVPVLSAMVISSFGGKILNKTVAAFPEVAAYQPVINGVAGNLLSVQASRISTSLHQNKSKPEEEGKVGRLLLAMVVPGHLIFNCAILLSGSSEAEQGVVSSSLFFLMLYLTAATIQVAILLQVASVLVHWLWSRGVDPDNAAIPYLTSLGDLLGGALLAAAFHFYYFNSQDSVSANTLTSLNVTDTRM